jgi:hypothetical protein
MDSRKKDVSDFFKPKLSDANVVTAKEYFIKCLGREELNKLFPNKEITYIQIHFIPHHDYLKGDVISNLDGMTMMSLEFSDGTKESIRWKDPKVKCDKSLSTDKPSISGTKSD